MPLYPSFNKMTWLVVALLLLAISGLTQLTSNASYLAYFDQDNTLVKAHLAKRAAFSTHDNLVLVLNSKDGSALSVTPNFYKKSKTLIKSISTLKEVQNVNSFLKEYRWRSSIFNQKKKKPAVLLSNDGRSALILIDVELENNKNAKQILSFNQEISELVKSHYEDPNIAFYLSGELGLNNAYIETLRHDLKRFLPLLLLTMLIVLGFILLNFKLSLCIFSIVFYRH